MSLYKYILDKKALYKTITSIKTILHNNYKKNTYNEKIIKNFVLNNFQSYYFMYNVLYLYVRTRTDVSRSR